MSDTVRAEDEGWEFAVEGGPRSACPYKEELEIYWLRGYDAGREYLDREWEKSDV